MLCWRIISCIYRSTPWCIHTNSNLLCHPLKLLDHLQTGVYTTLYIQSFIWALNGSWVVNFTPWPLYPRGKNPGTHWIGCCAGPRGGLDVYGDENISCDLRESNPGSSSPQGRHYANCVNSGTYNKCATIGRTKSAMNTHSLDMKLHLRISSLWLIITSTPRTSKWLLSFTFIHHNPPCTRKYSDPHLLHASPVLSISIW